MAESDAELEAEFVDFMSGGEAFQPGGPFVVLGFQHQLDRVDSQDLGHFSVQIVQEVFEPDRVQHLQDRAMHLIGASEVLIGGCDHGAMGVFQPVQPGFQPFHRDAAQIDDIAPHRAFICRHQGAHQVGIVQNDVRLLEKLLAQVFC